MNTQALVTIPRSTPRLGMSWFRRQWVLTVPLAMLIVSPFVCYCYLSHALNPDDVTARLLMVRTVGWTFWIAWLTGTAFIVKWLVREWRVESRARRARWEQTLQRLRETVDWPVPPREH